MNLGILESNWLRLQRQIARMTRRDDAEDLLHSSFVRMTEKTDRPVARPEAFLLRSAINAARDDFRRAAHPATPQQLDLRSSQVFDQTPLQDETLIARQRLERVKEGLQQLPPRSREIFLMHRLDGLKYREIADTLGISMSAVEKHITRSVQFLAAWTDGW
jgi:RNA polymerase sigma-70 factor (ECF subfamily)